MENWNFIQNSRQTFNFFSCLDQFIEQSLTNIEGELVCIRKPECYLRFLC